MTKVRMEIYIFDCISGSFLAITHRQQQIIINIQIARVFSTDNWCRDRSAPSITTNQPHFHMALYIQNSNTQSGGRKKIKWKILNEQRAIMSSRTNTCLLRVAWICIVCVSTNTPTRNSATPSPMFGHIAVASLFLSGILLIIRIPHRITLFALHMCFRMAINTNARSYDTQHQQYDGRIFWKRHTPCLFTTTAVAAATFS